MTKEGYYFWNSCFILPYLKAYHKLKCANFPSDRRFSSSWREHGDAWRDNGRPQGNPAEWPVIKTVLAIAIMSVEKRDVTTLFVPCMQPAYFLTVRLTLSQHGCESENECINCRRSGTNLRMCAYPSCDSHDGWWAFGSCWRNWGS